MVYGSGARLCMTAYSTALYWQQIGILPTTIRQICKKFRTSTLKTEWSVLYIFDHELCIQNQTHRPLYLHNSCHSIFFLKKLSHIQDVSLRNRSYQTAQP
jgi:hypothetical protein